MRRLLFEPATPDAFLQALRPIWQQDATWLPGEDEFAAALEAAALAEGLTVNHGVPPPDAPGCPLVILTETGGAALQTELLRFAELQNITLLAPITDWHFSQQPLFLISIPKAGTHLIYELVRAFGYHTGGEPPEFPNRQTWYNLEYQNAHTAAADFFVDTIRRAPFGNRHHRFMSSPAIFIYRHPLDILVSEAHYYHLDGKTAFAGWLEGLDFEARAGRLLNENFLLGSLRERIEKFLPWLDFPNVIVVSFEELVGEAGGGSASEQLDLIWSLLLKLQSPGDPAEIAAKIFNTAAATFRAGQIGAYRRELPSAWISRFDKTNKDVLAALGYSAEAGMLPETRLRRRHRPLSTSAQDFDSVPITLESGYLGCNLVRYQRRIYAVPVAAGAVALESLPAERLAALPSSTERSELKALLLIGAEELARRQHAFSQLGAMLQGIASPDRTYAYWTDVATPSLIESYKDFNIVYFDRRFYGIRQSLGEVDLTGDLRALLDTTPIDEFFVDASVAQLRDQIDGYSTSHRLLREIGSLHQAEAALAARLEGQRAEFGAAVAQARATAGDHLAAAEANWAARWTVQDEARYALQDAYDHAATASSEMREQLSQLEAGIAGLNAALAREAAAAELARAQIARMERQLTELGAALDGAVAAAAAAAEAHLQRQTDLLAELRGDLTSRLDAAMAPLQHQLEAQRTELRQHQELIAELRLSWPRRLARWIRRRA
jgi:hypothetical protein